MVDDITFSKDTAGIRRTLGARLRRTRLAREPRMTLKQLGGGRLSEAMLSRLERGDVLPSLESLLFLADRLGIQPGELLDSRPAVIPEEERQMMRGMTLLDLHHTEEALRAFQMAGTSERSLAGSIEACVQLGRLDEAESFLAATIASTPALHSAVGAIAHERGNLQAALSHFIQGIQSLKQGSETPVQPQSADVATRRLRAELLYRQARVHERLGNRETALVTFRQSLEAVAGLSDSGTVALSLIRHDHDSATPATTDLSAAAPLAAIDAVAHLELRIGTALGRLQLTLGRRRDALAVLHAACLLAIGRGPLPAELTSALDDAASFPHDSAESSRDAVDALEHLAMGYVASAQLGEADRAYLHAEQMAISQDSEVRGAALALRCGLMWLQAGDRHRAQPHLHRADALLESSRRHQTDGLATG